MAGCFDQNLKRKNRFFCENPGIVFSLEIIGFSETLIEKT